MENAVSCPYEGESEVRSLYLAGKLPDKEAEAFEAHYFACERCAEAVEVGTRLRSAFEKVPVTPAAISARTSRIWVPLAAAAAIAVVGLGVWQLAHRSRVETLPTVERGTAADSFQLRVAAGPRGYELTWSPHPEASAYRVEVLASDGVRVWQKETRETHLSIGPGVVPAPPEGTSLAIQVEALDPMRQVVAASEMVSLPSP